MPRRPGALPPVLLCAALALAATASALAEEPIAAKVGDRTITLAELDAQAKIDNTAHAGGTVGGHEFQAEFQPADRLVVEGPGQEQRARQVRPVDRAENG